MRAHRLSLRPATWLLCALPVFALAPFLWLAHGHQTPLKKEPVRSPLSPKQAQAAFRLAPGLRIELVAVEPQLQSPVAIAFDEDGRLLVVEMPDYPNGPPKGQPPQGRIKILEDRDGDGFYEHSTVYADKLLFANGLLPWDHGLLVTQAPNILLLRDTRGVGRADKAEILFEGFAAQNPQLRVSNPKLGLDGWIYVANGLRGGTVKRSGRPGAKPIELGSMDFRFDLSRDRYEAISGPGQYGNAFDDWGQRFVCDNRHHLRHVVLANRYLKRNPDLGVPAVVEDVSELGEGPLSSGGKVYPISKNWTTSNLHAGRFTAACGVFIYRGNLLPKPYQGAAFTCEPTGNLVHCEILEPKGATFHAHPDRKGVEFLATRDDWCRPVFLTEGPDGALYMVDMYRAVIEHPDFMPPELQKRPDLTLGKERGRIWRIVPENHKTKVVRPNLSKATTAELVKLLGHPGEWWRTTAQRLLLQRRDKAAIKPLHLICEQHREPRTQVLAAWLLDYFESLDNQLLLKLLQSKHPRVREQAVLLAESQLATDGKVLGMVSDLADDDDPRVRFQVALSLGLLQPERIGQYQYNRILRPLVNVALLGADDPWTRYAVESAVPGRAGALLVALLKVPSFREKQTAGQEALLRELAFLVGSRRDHQEVLAALEALHGQEAFAWRRYQLIGLEGLADGMSRRGTGLPTYLASPLLARNETAQKFARLIPDLARVRLKPNQEISERLLIVRLLAYVPWKQAGPALGKMLKEDSRKEVQMTVLRALATHDDPQVADILLASWRSYTPTLRSAALETLLRRRDWSRALLKAVEAGTLKASEIDAPSMRRLLNSKEFGIRPLAEKLLRGNLPADRQKVLNEYRAALKLKGNARHGQKIFEKHCATCHRIDKIGVDVGPDISDTRTKTREALLTDIIVPNQAIDNNYVNYLVVFKNGRVASGIIATDTGSSLTLRRAGNESEIVLRQDIDEITSTGLSLMPDGLEKDIPVQEMADLLAFLKNWRYLDSGVPAVGAGTP